IYQFKSFYTFEKQFTISFISVQCQAIRDKAFRAQREYIYQYETQLVTGMEPFTAIHSGFRLSATARVQFSTGTEVDVHLENMFVYRINKPVKQYQADSNMIPKQFISEGASEMLPLIISVLKIPFRFKYSKGHVIKVMLSDKETEWSANTKRGFVSLFEVNLEKRMLLQQLSQPAHTTHGPTVDNYKVMEKAVTGDCATTYTVKSRLTTSHFFVSKVRDFDNCLEKPVYFKSIVDGYPTPTHQKDNPLSVGATVEYSLSGTTTRFLILSAIAQTKIIFTPVTQNGAIRTTVNQTLYLKDAGPIQQNVPTLTPREHERNKFSEELRMSLPGQILDPQDPFQSRGENSQHNPSQSEADQKYNVDEIYTQLLHAAQNTQQVTSQEALVRLRLAVTMLKASPREIIRELWEKIQSGTPHRSETELAKKALWNVLPHVGTEGAALHILDVCTNDTTMRSNCTTALNTLTLKVTPTTETIEKLIALIEALATTGRPDKLTQVSYLSLGSLSYKLSLAKYWNMEEIKRVSRILADLRGRHGSRFVRQYLSSKRRDVRTRKTHILNVHAQTNHRIVETIKKLIDEGTQAERVLGLKSLANAGDTESLSILKQIITNRNEPLFIRIFAVTAHRRMYLEPAAHQQAIGTLLSVYQDSMEMHEIRSAAFRTMMGLWPDQDVITGIAQDLHSEQDIRVSQYVSSYLDRLANSSYTPLWELNKKCKDAMKFSPPNYKADYYHPFEKSIGMMFPDHKAGIDLRVSALGSPYKFGSLSFGMDTYIYGVHSTFFELGINSEGMSPVLADLFGPKGLLSHSQSLLDLMRRAPGAGQSQAIIDEIFEKLKVQPRTESLPSAHVYYMVMGHELDYVDFTEILSGINTRGLAAVQVDVDQLKASLPIHYEDLGFQHDTQLSLPSEAGLPVSLKLQASNTVKMDGLLTVDALPFFSKSGREGPLPSTLAASIDLKPKMVTALYGSMGLDWHVAPALAFHGIFKNSMPIRNDLVYNIQSQTLKIINHVPKLSKPMMEVIIEPYGEFQTIRSRDRDTDDRVKSTIDRTPLLATTGTKVTPLDLSYDIDAMGLKLGVQGQVPDNWGLKTPLRPLSGRTVLNFYLSPLGDEAPDTITIQSQIVELNPDSLEAAPADWRADQRKPKNQASPTSAPTI
ncbi:hypothetical protein EGW08_015354, partial [Elysia chlorotica]